MFSFYFFMFFFWLFQKTNFFFVFEKIKFFVFIKFFYIYDDDYEEDEEEVFICFHSIFFRFDSSIIKKFCFHSIFFVYKIFHLLVNPAPATAGAAPPKNRPREASVL